MPGRRDRTEEIFTGSGRKLIAAGVSSHLFEDHLLVFTERTQTLYTFNPSAGFIWSCCEEGMNEHEIAEALGTALGVDNEQARHDVRNATQEWISLGLIEESPGDHDGTTLAATPREAAENLVPLELMAPHSLPRRYAFELAGQGFELRFSDENLKRLVIEPFLHLSVDSVSSPITIDIFESEGLYAVTREKVSVVERTVLDGLPPVVAQEALSAACEQGDFLICIHAAVHSLGERCIVFPGIGGTGKTTLSAALIKDGFRYFTDEVALLDRRTFRVIPAPVSLRVKQGSWQIVSSLFPDFLTRPSHLLNDGSRLRLLRPPPGSFAKNREDSSMVKCLVFPSHAPAEKTSIRRISRIEALRRIQECGYRVSGRLDRITVARILQWIGTVDCYDMTINSLPEAVAIVRGLLE
jgi:hypothetical protein